MFHSRDFYRLGVVAIFIFALVEHVNGIAMEYCSSLNTATTSGNSSIYQSDGLCHDFCAGDYAFAIVQAEYCWCSNYAPGTTTSTSDCSSPCPGYPDDTCGGSGTYGYMGLGLSPSGTKGATTSSTSSSTTVTTSSSSPVEVTTTVTEISSIDPPKTTTSTSTSETSETSDTSTTTTRSIQQTTVAAQQTTAPASTSSTWTPTPIISLETITGQVRTVTVTPTAPPSESSTSSVSRKSAGGLTTGGAVGLTIGLVALIAIIVGVTYFCIRKRRQQKAEEYAAVNSRRESLAGVGGPIPPRGMSENSRYVLGTDGRRVVERWEPELNTPGSRGSQLMPVDPRLDPFAAVYQRGENKSRESINTIRDDHDYSRRVHQQGPILRAVNPDPD
ncbi:e8131479-f94b-4739-9e84-30a81c898609 [Sclerotinia trifoliorum]|uniref:E8131479-f94b-4739-9e84-30a81c898609 n=1 Tax=Sclerotinia trifoliorum TaxID=28548 RepID=A0A8H2ZRP2_9HELO|nr:e8131479-f94b-4739-9e84-30a81c898609 [Sclerotinia trifoliorum]